MKTVSVLSAILVGTSYAQQAAFMSDMNMIGWTENSPDGTKDEDTGTVVNPQSGTETIFADIQTASEQNDDQAELVEYRKKYEGIYDPNMFPYGPLHADTRIQNTDDAVSDPITLPSTFPLFNGMSTDTIRAQSNGLIIMSADTVLDSEPQPFNNNNIDPPFIAGFWNDIWSKKHGRMYMRLEQTNTTLLSEMKNSIIDGFPEMDNGGLGDIQYAFIFSMWRVTHFGAVKSPQNQNTFQIAICTDGTHSFMINNYQLLEWSIAVGTNSHGAAGYDIAGFNSGNLLAGSMTAGILDLSTTSTNSNMNGRHILRLDDNPIEYPTTTTEATTTTPTTTATTATTQAGNGTTPMPTDTNVFTEDWPGNDNTLGGAIGHYKPGTAIGNGTCSITFPTTVAWFHVFDAHIRADSASAMTSWSIVGANPTFEPGTDGTFSYIVFFEDGNEFAMEDVMWNCDDGDLYNYAVYSFPQNYEQKDTRSNVRVLGNSFDSSVSLSLGQQVQNFTLDDGRMTAQTADNQNFVITNIPDSIQEIWFQFTYINFFGSNEVGVTGS